jgi:hypothetical protein
MAERKRIEDALKFCDIPTIQFNKDSIPKQLPCAIVILDSETGKNGTCRQFVSTDIAWTVFLIVNAHNVLLLYSFSIVKDLVVSYVIVRQTDTNVSIFYIDLNILGPLLSQFLQNRQHLMMNNIRSYSIALH